MKATGHQRARSGLVLAEAAVSVALLLLLLAMVSMLMTGFQRSSDTLLNTRRAQWAAETMLEQMRAGIEPVAGRSFESTDGVAFDVAVSDGNGEWQGLRFVAVKASVTGKHGRVAKHTVRAYLPAASSRAEGES